MGKSCLSMSRRNLLRSAAGGVAALAVLPLLAACGGDDDDEPTATPAQAAPTPTSPAAEATATTAAPAPTATTAAPAASPTSPPSGSADRLMGKQIEATGSEGGTLILATPYGGETISPFDAYPYAYIAFELLVELHPDTSELVGNLAEGWEVSADGLTVTCNLRSGVTWHDGEAFTADDVTTTYTINTNPDNLYASAFSGIARVETLDELTVAFTLASPDVDFIPGTLAIWPVGADHIWNGVDVVTLYEDGGVTGADPARVIGTGPFMFSEISPAEHISFAAYPDYWDGAPHLDEVIYRVTPDPTAMSQMLITGSLDAIPFPPGVDPAAVIELERAGGITLPQFPAGDVQLIYFNQSEELAPFFTDVNVRKALLLAIDRELLLEGVLFGYGQLAHGVITPLSWAYSDDVDPTYAYDPDGAAALLDEAGWVAGSGGARAKDGTPLSFTVSVWEANVDSISYAEAIQQFWADIGVAMEIQVETTAVYFEKFSAERTYQAVIGTHYPGSSPIFAPSFLCEGDDNRIGYCNPDVDALLFEAAGEPDREKRVGLYTQANSILMQDVAVAPLAFTTGIAAVSERAHNLFPNAVNFLFNAETWWIES